MLTVLCSGKGSPGVTASALALSAAWPNPPAMLVEADEAGGDLAIRVRTASGKALPESPTVATLAADARGSDRDPQLVARRALRLNGQLSVVPGFASAEQGAGMVSLWETLATALAASECDVIADLGRLHAGSLAMRVAEAADVVVVVGRADVASVVHLRARITVLGNTLDAHRGRPPTIVPLLVTKARTAARDVDEVVEVLAAGCLGTPTPLYLAWDPAALASLEAGDDPRGRLRRTTLLRTAQQASDQLANHRIPTAATEVAR